MHGVERIPRSMEPLPREVIERLVREHEGYVRGLALRLAPNAADADDIAQEAFLVAFRKGSETLDTSRDLRPWLATVVRNLSRRAWEAAIRDRKLKKDGLSDYLEQLSETPTVFFEGSAKAALRSCLEKLPERSRTLLNLRYNLCLNSEAIAGKITARAEAVRMDLVRIRQQLRGCVEKTIVEAEA